MKAWVTGATVGYPQCEHIEIGSQGLGDVSVDMQASALNHRDLWITKGLYPGIKPQIVMGSDGVGMSDGREVILFPSVAWGEDERAQSEEFRVLGVPDHGTWAEKIYVPRDYIFAKPSHLTTHQAAALPLAGLTAYRAVFSRAQLTSNDRVLVTGIGGGVALFAMQYAVALGCEVIVTSSDASKIDKALSLGAKAGYLYTDDAWPQALTSDYGGVDVIVDGACGPTFNHLVKVSKPGGRIVFYGATRGHISELNARAVFWKQLNILGTTMGSRADFSEMLDYVERHKIIPVVDSVYGWSQVHEALDLMDRSGQFGKIIIDHIK
jgi:zinc-binding alcohol dehydrogenase/oxidoreductase